MTPQAQKYATAQQYKAIVAPSFMVSRYRLTVHQKINLRANVLNFRLAISHRLFINE